VTSESSGHELPGHHWKDPERVRDFAGRMDRRVEDRGEQFQLIARIIGARGDAPLRLLDVGAGYGALAAALLDAYPKATATLLDVSEAMIKLGRERMQAYDGRYSYVAGDFAGGSLPDDVGGGFDAIVSSLAIHHLPPERIRTLYADIAARLSSGGWFLNLDIVAPDDSEAGEVYRRVLEEDRIARGETPWPSESGNASHHSEMQPLAEHLGWLREAGLTAVACYSSMLGIALFGGRKP